MTQAFHNRSVLRIATRKSPLALWQATHVGSLLQNVLPNISIEYVKRVTEGDRLLESRLADKGGKGLFVKELEIALTYKEADLAVHSMKDVPMSLPDGFALSAILKRAAVEDALVSLNNYNLVTLPPNARIGTSSLRRQTQLLALRPDLRIEPIRGNVQTRLNLLNNKGFDAIILAQAGLERLQIQGYDIVLIDPMDSVPAVGQGAIGIEIRADDAELHEFLMQHLNHSETALAVIAERRLNLALGGGCQFPIAGHATWQDQQLSLNGVVGNSIGYLLRAQAEEQFSTDVFNASHIKQAEQLGERVAGLLQRQGANQLIQDVKSELSKSDLSQTSPE
ncbi:MAG: hydroxymethylbilane synthase [Pseudomonadota bacterium]